MDGDFTDSSLIPRYILRRDIRQRHSDTQLVTVLTSYSFAKLMRVCVGVFLLLPIRKFRYEIAEEMPDDLGTHVDAVTLNIPKVLSQHDR